MMIPVKVLLMCPICIVICPVRRSVTPENHAVNIAHAVFARNPHEIFAQIDEFVLFYDDYR